MSAPALRTLRRVAVRVEGVVQGVGFRPFVHRIANAHALAGYVLNDSEGVLAEVEGQPADVDRFLYDLVAAAPALAHVETVRVTDLAPAGRRGFAIVASPPTRDRAGARQVPVTPDCAPCADCLRELRDPEDRRFRYPFVNCTNCGPRFTIVRGVPYDRPRTTMSAFAMCDACQTEYDDPADRRFHAQPNACPACGPQARLIDPRSGEPVTSGGPPGARGDSPEAGRSADAVAAGAALLRDGRILAVKGLGGYHLACRADDEEVVARLRARKHREDRPFALMVADVDAARRLARLEVAAVEMLESVARPIVLAPRRERTAVAASVAPRVAELGVMLPSTPLHHLLLDDLGDVPLVMTSGNVSDEPIAYRDEDAMSRLAPIADAMLVHDRPIHMRADDGVVRVAAGAPLTVRRSRGHVPGALRLPIPAPRDVLACGAELKSTFCVARGGEAWVGHHLGDLRNAEVLASFVEGVAHFEDLLGVRPRVVAHDLHPDYLSTRYALERDGVDVVGVQHHHAHLAACLAEHGVTDRAVGAIYDGA
ncbi:carbamoyltransferase HypF, partial [Paraconexibacter sp.]|uniref:carbamoyltransferase HypF n=1 Tax=Paraconexibacter sp. TaxID=2949640 RepID=UPI003561E6B4